MRRLIILVALLALLPSAAQADGPCMPPRYGWKWNAMPITYRIASPDIDPADVLRAMALWESAGLQFKEDSASPNTIGVGNLGSAGLASVVTNEGRIRFTVLIDDNLSRDMTVPVLVHELGHIIGFGHTTCGGGIMASRGGGTMSTGDLLARDLLYPSPHRIFVPIVSRLHDAS